MAHTLSLTTSHARLRSYCVQVEASLEAVPTLAPLAERWRGLKGAVVEHRALAEGGADTLTRARAVHRVRDAAWDGGYSEGSGIAYLLSGKRANNEPYATVFRVPSRRATSLGHAKATEVGARALAEAKRVGDAMLTTWAERFEPMNHALVESGRAMDQAEVALDDPRYGKRALIRQINQAIALTEAEILIRFPGKGSLADAILVPVWARRGKGSTGKRAVGGPNVDDDTDPIEDGEDVDAGPAGEDDLDAPV